MVSAPVVTVPDWAPGMNVQLRMSLSSSAPPVAPVNPTQARLLVLGRFSKVLKSTRTPPGNKSAPSRITSMLLQSPEVPGCVPPGACGPLGTGPQVVRVDGV